MALPRLQAEDRHLLRGRAAAVLRRADRRALSVPDQDDVRRLALALPEVEESTDDFGFSVAGKRFAWLWRERVDPRKTKVPNPEVVVLRVTDLAEKEALVASLPGVFTEPHYDGYKAVLVRLPDVADDDLTELVTDSWRAVAPRRLHDRLGPTT
jgi:hypothetical protein